MCVPRQPQSKLPRAPREGLFLPFESVCARARYLALGFLLPAAGQCAGVLTPLAGSVRLARGGVANRCVRPCPPKAFPKVAAQTLLLGLVIHLRSCEVCRLTRHIRPLLRALSSQVIGAAQLEEADTAASPATQRTGTPECVERDSSVVAFSSFRQLQSFAFEGIFRTTTQRSAGRPC